MISHPNLQAYLATHNTDLSGIFTTEKCRTTYDMAAQMIVYANQQLALNNTAALKNCFLTAEEMYKDGDSTVKNAIENVFVYGFTRSFFQDDESKSITMNVLPDSLFCLYKKQVIASHI